MNEEKWKSYNSLRAIRETPSTAVGPALEVGQTARHPQMHYGYLKCGGHDESERSEYNLADKVARWQRTGSSC